MLRGVTSFRVWVGACGKWRYQTRPQAMDELLRIRAERGPSQAKEKAVYWCPNCKGWHTTRKINESVNNNAPEIRKMLRPA